MVYYDGIDISKDYLSLTPDDFIIAKVTFCFLAYVYFVIVPVIIRGNDSSDPTRLSGKFVVYFI